jgi:uncharacterized peroxidase-related enzyme
MYAPTPPRKDRRAIPVRAHGANSAGSVQQSNVHEFLDASGGSAYPERESPRASPRPMETMPHIALPPGVPGIVAPMMAYPETAAPLNALAEALLRGPSSLTPAERELIAAFVSRRNDCVFCSNSHAAVSRYHFGADRRVVDLVLEDMESAPISEKMRALLRIAGRVQRSGREVESSDVEAARAAGADDKAIHDTVLIAAAFCMFNRYVDGLATWAPSEPEVYEQMGERLGTVGYINAIPPDPMRAAVG